MYHGAKPGEKPMRLTVLILAVLALAAPAVAEPKAADPCEAPGACRAVGDIPIAAPKGKTATYTVGKTAPWIVQNNLLLFGGETVVFRLDPDGRFHRLTLVATGAEARARKLQPGELRAALGASDAGTTLTIESAHDKWLNYMAVMATPDGKGQKTSVCTLMTGKLAIEHWPGPVVYLALTNFEAVPEGEMVCK
jgi:hypothetical protein